MNAFQRLRRAVLNHYWRYATLPRGTRALVRWCLGLIGSGGPLMVLSALISIPSGPSASLLLFAVPGLMMSVMFASVFGILSATHIAGPRLPAARVEQAYRRRWTFSARPGFYPCALTGSLLIAVGLHMNVTLKYPGLAQDPVTDLLAGLPLGLLTLFGLCGGPMLASLLRELPPPAPQAAKLPRTRTARSTTA